LRVEPPRDLTRFGADEEALRQSLAQQTAGQRQP
jgi:hypothetical protein